MLLRVLVCVLIVSPAAAGDWDGVVTDVAIQECAGDAWSESVVRDRAPALAAPAGLYLVEVDERGVDVVLHGPDAASDSAPGGHGRELLFAEAGADGALPTRIEIVDRSDPAPRLYVRLRCAARLATVERTALRLLAHAQRRLNDAEQIQHAFWLRNAARREAAYAALAAAAIDAGSEAAAQAWHQAGFLALRLMQDPLAAQAYAQAESGWRRHGRDVQAALALLGRARAELAQRQPSAGATMADAERALRAQELQEDADIAAHDVCLALRFAERPADAAVCYGHAAERFAAHGEAGTQADALVNQSTALLYAGDATASERAARRSVDVARAIGDQTREALAFARLAAIAAWRGELDRALAHYMRASQAVQQQGDGFWIAHFDIRIGETLELAGERARAAAYYRRAYDGVHALNARKAADALRSLARMQAADDDLDGAERGLQQAQHLYASANVVPPALAAERIALALRRSDADAARRLLATAPRSGEWQVEAELRLAELTLSDAPLDALQALHDEARERGHARLRFATAAVVARALVAADRIPDAIALADAELADGVRMIGNVRAPGMRAAFAPALNELAAVRAHAVLSNAAHVTHERALQAIAPAEALRAAIARRAPSAASPDTVAAIERLVGQQWGLGQVAAEGPQPLRELDTAALQLTASAADRPDAADASAPQDTRRATLYVIAGETRTLALAFAPDRVQWFELPAPSVLAARIAPLQRLLETPASALPDVAAAAASLADALRWHELLQAFDGDTLTIVADGVLADVPWTLLPLDRADAVAALGYAPALLEWNVVLASRFPSADASVGTPSDLHLVFSSGDAAAVAALRGEQHERIAIERALLDAPVKVHAHAPSTANLLAALQQPAIVHIAAHGRADRQRTEAAGLWLQDADDPEPGFFSAARLAAIAVQARLVVLTACDSAGGRALAGQPVPGFAGSLLAAGADVVVGHRWQVDDHAMAAFVGPFYRELRDASPGAAAHALRTAQRELLTARRYRHPYYWAGWMVAEGRL